jgi:hypothetical protein
VEDVPEEQDEPSEDEPAQDTPSTEASDG